MRYQKMFEHPTRGRVRYANEGVLTSDGRRVVLIEYEVVPFDRRSKAYQGFYQSSGMMSKYEGTWFPFDGDVIDANTGERLLLKLDTTNFARQFKTFVQKTSPADVTFQKNMIKFGTGWFAYISYKMGGGIWDDRRQVAKIKKRLPKTFWDDNDEAVSSAWTLSKVKFGRARRTQKDVNVYLGNALSMNFLKGSEYPASMNGDWILDYREIYGGKEFAFYQGTRIDFKRTLLTHCPHASEPVLLDFMIQYDHATTSLSNFFYPSMGGLSIFEDKYCRTFKKKTIS